MLTHTHTRAHTYTHKFIGHACTANRKSFLSKTDKKESKLSLFVWKRNEAEQNGRLNSVPEKGEWRGESGDRRGKQWVRQAVCVLGVGAGTQGQGPQAAPQQEREDGGGGGGGECQTTQTTIESDKSHI